MKLRWTFVNILSLSVINCLIQAQGGMYNYIIEYLYNRKPIYCALTIEGIKFSIKLIVA